MAIGGFVSQGIAQGFNQGEQLAQRRRALDLDRRRVDLAEQQLASEQQATRQKQARDGLMAFFDQAMKIKGEAGVSSAEFDKTPAAQSIYSYFQNEAPVLAQLGGIDPQLVAIMGERLQNMPTAAEAATQAAIAEAKGEVAGTQAIIEELGGGEEGEALARDLGLLEQTPTSEALARVEAARAVATETGVPLREALIGQGVMQRPPQAPATPAAQIINFEMPGGEVVSVRARDQAGIDRLIEAGGTAVEKRGRPPAATITPFEMPDGTTRTVDMRNPEEVEAARAEGGIPVPRSVTATRVTDLTKADPETVAAARKQVGDLSQQISAIESTAKAFRDNPEAGGLVGPIIENVGGVIQQFEAGQRLLERADIDPAEVAAVRTKGRAVVAQMLETITGETGGRFTDTERRIASETLKALDPRASAPQIQAAFQTVLDIMRPAQLRQVVTLLNESGEDLTNLQSVQNFADILISNGMPEDQAEEIILNILNQRGIVLE